MQKSLKIQLLLLIPKSQNYNKSQVIRYLKLKSRKTCDTLLIILFPLTILFIH